MKQIQLKATCWYAMQRGGDSSMVVVPRPLTSSTDIETKISNFLTGVAPDFNSFVPGLAYHFYLTLPTKFKQPRDYSSINPCSDHFLLLGFRLLFPGMSMGPLKLTAARREQPKAMGHHVQERVCAHTEGRGRPLLLQRVS